eukprot:TRINITY_DN18980_c0_g1_i1.p1 TRINITY_DN18980_c0_g1~~TRINITY_DN18980_c0_g1_i1.p1  ORF type:complete len:662 (+),score=135.61 TRINITY_DN18980_c0_g1_i1:92-1987(+)
MPRKVFGGVLALAATRYAVQAGQPNSLPFSDVQVPGSDKFPDIEDIPHAEEVAKPAAYIIKGLTEGFVGKSVTAAQRSCLAKGASGLAADVTGTSVDTVHKLHAIFGDMKGVAQDFAALANKDKSPMYPNYGMPMQGMGMGMPMQGMPMQGTPMQPGAMGPMMSPAAAANLPPAPVDANGNFQIPPGGFTTAYGVPQGGLPHWARTPNPAGGLLGSTETAVTTVEMARLTALELSHSLNDMFEVEHSLAKKCLQGASLDMIAAAQQHMKNMTYVGGHLVANGADVIHNLASAVTSYDDNDMEKFGRSIGGAWRQVLLADPKSSTSLVQHMEEFIQDLKPAKLMKAMDEDSMERMTEGMVTSLFGDGFSVQLLAPGAGEISTTPSPGGWMPPADPFWDGDKKGIMQFKMPDSYRVATNDTAVNINLHECIQGNSELFHDAYKPVVGLSEQFMEGHCTGAVRSLCMSLWTVVLSDVQQALTTCGFTPDQERVLIHALWAGKLFHGNLSLPDQEVRAHDVTVTMAEAIEEFQDDHYKRFGAQLGTLMREMIVVSFPEEYTKDEHGNLKRVLRDLAQPQRSSTGAAALLLLAAGSLGAAVLFALAKRTRRAAAQLHPQMLLESELADPEAGAAVE